VCTNIPGNGYYRVKRIYSERRNELFYDQAEQKDKSMRIIFELGEFVPLGERRMEFSYGGNDSSLAVPNVGTFLSLKQIKEEYFHMQGRRR